MAGDLEPIGFADLAGFDEDDCVAAFRAFRRSAEALAAGVAPTRPGCALPPALAAIAREAVSMEIAAPDAARAFFEARFRPWRLRPGGAPGFLTGYFEPRLRGSLTRGAAFATPVLARPDDLVALAPGQASPCLDPAVAGAQRLPGGALRPYPARAAIEAAAAAGEGRPILWLEDAVELFIAQVQGSASVELPDGRLVRLAYDGRNGQPYTSIGRLLIEAGEIPESAMSLARLKAWLRAHGLAPGAPARNLMQRNLSYVFFRLETDFDPAEGPTGGAGVALTALRSIAVDRALWPYGTPFWLDALLPWREAGPTPFRRLTIAQDTGSAILGAARADLFFGGGDEAGRRAGDIRHACDFTVLLPRGETP
ncbi:MAG: MltA domain-containing protein [Roseiarcus sp.]|jgi:membrane-bound lytic murein transglycosylase A